MGLDSKDISFGAWWSGTIPLTAPLDIVTGPMNVTNTSAPDLAAFSLAPASVN